MIIVQNRLVCSSNIVLTQIITLHICKEIMLKVRIYSILLILMEESPLLDWVLTYSRVQLRITKEVSVVHIQACKTFWPLLLQIWALCCYETWRSLLGNRILTPTQWQVIKIHRIILKIIQIIQAIMLKITEESRTTFSPASRLNLKQSTNFIEHIHINTYIFRNNVTLYY